MLKTLFAAYLSFGLAAAFSAVGDTPDAAPEAAPAVAEAATPEVVQEAPSVDSVMVDPPADAAPAPPAEYRDAIVVEETWEQPEVVEPSVVHGAAVECFPVEVTRERVTRSAEELFACQDVVPVTLCVENPADCCLYSVTLCVPCCCVDEARLCYADRGFLGRGKVGYEWSCGLHADIVFRARGDAVVAYSM